MCKNSALLVLAIAVNALWFATPVGAQAISFRAPLNTTIDQDLNDALAGVVTADFNGDGKPDLAYLIVSGGGSFPSGGNLTVLLGNGDGTFLRADSFDVSRGAAKLTISISWPISELKTFGSQFAEKRF